MEQKKQLNKIEPLTQEELCVAYENLDITDDFMFGKVMQDERNTIELLERLTGNQIDSVRTAVGQKVIKITNDSKGVRYDVYVEDGQGVMYDAEMQKYRGKKKTATLPKRARFYQGLMDLNILNRGEEYAELKQSYVIFICTFDPFGKGLCCYEFENICKDCDDLPLGDKRKVLFFNTKGKTINVSKKTADLLRYMETKQITDEFTERLEDDVFKARQNKEWMVEYMKTYVWEMDARNEGREEGREEGVAALISTLQDFDCSKADTLHKVMEKMELSESVAEEYIEKYWRE
jgi:predicted transposase/invertase (TIGR01784 family)